MGAVNDMLMVEEALRGKQVDAALAAANIALREEIARLREALDTLVGEIRCHDEKCIDDNGALDCLQDLRAQADIIADRVASPSESEGQR